MTESSVESVLSSSNEELRVNISLQSKRKRTTCVSAMEDKERPFASLIMDIFLGMYHIRSWVSLCDTFSY